MNHERIQVIPEKDGFSETLWQALKTSISFVCVPLKVQYQVHGRILKELVRIYEAEGEEYFGRFCAALWDRLTRVNWVFNKYPKYPFVKWSEIKKELKSQMNPINQLPANVVLDAAVKIFTDQHKAKSYTGWVKKPQGGWMKAQDA